jgi:integrase
MGSKRGTGSVYLRGKVWWIKYSRDGRPFRESARSSKREDALQLLRDRMGRMAHGVQINPRADRVTWNELCANLLTHYGINRRPLATAKNNIRHLTDFFGGWRAHRITGEDVQRYVLNRQDQGAANATINRELATLRRAFNKAIKDEKIHHKPAIEMLVEDNIRTGFFESEALGAVRRQLPEILADIATVAYWTGWRRGDILELECRQIDLERHCLEIERGRTKNKEPRKVFLPTEAWAIVEKWHQRRRFRMGNTWHVSRWLFHRNGQRVKPFHQTFKRACTRAGYPGAIFHDFRRTAVRNLVRARVPEKVAMEITGHKTSHVFDRYNIVSDDDLQEAARRLEEQARIWAQRHRSGERK